MSERKKSLKGSWLWGALLFAVLVLIDMVTKILADAYFDVGDPYFEIIPGYLEWGLAYNRGVAFSMMKDMTPPAKMALVWSTVVVFVVFTIYYLKIDPRRRWVRVALVLIIAGGVGNLIDRVYYQVWEPYSATDPSTWDGVRDMVRLKIFMFDFGVCNFADFFIVGGAITLMAAILFFDAGAMFPLTKKYKALSKEYEEREEQKQAKKLAKKQERALRNMEAKSIEEKEE
ncbi:MAG: signal peptidase II [Clostridiales bacterium]|jgi:signal peptidase II|nr:signal peptidase II [Clostridiales bacterium]